ncbi:MAG: thymidine kinase [Actinomycetia bacterium]|nr:thymidine kinase [Actinomycetes bacterium]MCP5030226.1 thymidine kinase [Actinomycetes bacterium]
MARLRFYFGTMGSGKSTQALQIHHNLTSRGLAVILTTQLDREVGRVSSRLGVTAEAEVVNPRLDLLDLAMAASQRHGLDAMVCDEAQFYEPSQIDQLAQIVDDLNVDVYAFGLLTSFQGQLFAGTQRLLELSDERNEIQVEARCWCGERATHNARLINGTQVYSGELMVVGDTATAADETQREVSYELMCRRHWHTELRANRGDQLNLLEQSASTLA